MDRYLPKCMQKKYKEEIFFMKMMLQMLSFLYMISKGCCFVTDIYRNIKQGFTARIRHGLHNIGDIKATLKNWTW